MNTHTILKRPTTAMASWRPSSGRCDQMSSMPTGRQQARLAQSCSRLPVIDDRQRLSMRGAMRIGSKPTPVTSIQHAHPGVREFTTKCSTSNKSGLPTASTAIALAAAAALALPAGAQTLEAMVPSALERPAAATPVLTLAASAPRISETASPAAARPLPAASGSYDDFTVASLLRAAQREPSSFPADFAEGLQSGKVTPDVLRRYLALESHPLLGLFMPIAGVRQRLLADPSFPTKMGIELSIGICTKCTAEYTKRGKKGFFAQLDYVAANVLMALIADFMLTWLPAPTLTYSAAPQAAASPSALSAWLATLPANAFVLVQPGTAPFSLAQRLGAILRNGVKLFSVGFAASMIGVGLTNALNWLRCRSDPQFKPANAPQRPLPISAGYGAYLATSSNLRYQIVAGIIEERGIEVLFAGNPQLCAVLSFIVRTGNTFLGSLLWVDFLRLTGLQKELKLSPPGVDPADTTGGSTGGGSIAAASETTDDGDEGIAGHGEVGTAQRGAPPASSKMQGEAEQREDNRS